MRTHWHVDRILLLGIVVFISLFLFQGHNANFLSIVSHDNTSQNPKDAPTPSETISAAPWNLTRIVVDDGFRLDFGLNASLNGFLTEWERLYGSPLSITDLDSTLPYGGLTGVDIPNTLNGSLLLGNATAIITPEITWIPIDAPRQVVRILWSNGTAGNGWALYAEDVNTTMRAVSYFSIMFNKIQPWDALNTTFHYTMQVGDTGWGIDPATLEAQMISWVQRMHTCVQLWGAPLLEMSNFTLSGYNSLATPERLAPFSANLSLLRSYCELGAKYHMPVFIGSDEVLLDEGLYNWLVNRLGYSGERLNEYFPDTINGQDPRGNDAIYEMLAAKYDGLVKGITPIVRDIPGGFGGFYFRTDDISQMQYYAKFGAVFSLPARLTKFLNNTTEAAERLNASVINRMWMLGEGENTFNNATLAAEALDPITRTNLILRTKETWNDHWYNSPPNPTIGVSHHPWIIGYSTGAAFPDFKGGLYDWYSDGGMGIPWNTNPLVIGLDGNGLSSATWTRMDVTPWEGATAYYLAQVSFNGSVRAPEALQKYFYKIGFSDPATIANLTQVFTMTNEAFRQVIYFKGWSTSGHFRGDLVNNGNSFLFEPGRVQRWYEVIAASTQYGIEYSIQEGFNGRDYTHQILNWIPQGIPDYGELPAMSDSYYDPPAVADPTNLTQQLGFIRGALRCFADFTDVFAEWRAWFLTYWHWLNTWDPTFFFRAETHRLNVVTTFTAYNATWIAKGYPYVANGHQLTQYWWPFVGQLDQLRDQMLIVFIILAAAIVGLIISVRPTARSVIISTIRVVTGLYSKRKFFATHEGSNARALMLWPSWQTQRTRWWVMSTVIPVGVLISWYLIVQALAANLITLFPVVVPLLIGSIMLGCRIATIALPNRLPRLGGQRLAASCAGLFWHILLIGFLAILFSLGGIFILVPGNMPYIVLGTVVALLGFSTWAYTRGLYVKRIYILLNVLLTIGLSLLLFTQFTLNLGGPLGALEGIVGEIEGL